MSEQQERVPTTGAPRVFISSTVLDFKDLRSALRYLLEQYGFEVLTSDTADFPHRLDVEAREAAVATVDMCGYYVLLVGHRYGTRLGDISVTQTEYRRAVARAQSGEMSLLVLARESVVQLWRHPGSAPPKEADDWTGTCEFLSEIAGQDLPGVSNWVHPFGSFRDVAEVVTANLRLTGPLRRRALEANLLWEARENVKRCFYARRGHPPRLIPGTFDASTVPEPGDLSASYNLSKAQAQQLAWFRLLCPGGVRGLKRAILEDAITSGEFLDFRRADAGYDVGGVQALLLELSGRIEQLAAASDPAILMPDMQADLAAITRAARRDSTGGVRVHGDTLRWFFVLRNQLFNIYASTVMLARHLSGIDPSLRSAVMVPVMKPEAPDDPEGDRDMSDEEVDGVLGNAIPPE